MNFSNLFRLFIMVGLCFLAQEGFAQSFNYNTQPKGINLPVQNVLQVDQDSLGRMWFSTTRGTFFTDGIQTFSLPDTLTSQFNYRISVLVDEEGIVWLYNGNGTPKVFRGGYGTWEEVKLGVEFEQVHSSQISFFVLGKGSDKCLYLDTKKEFLRWQEKNEVRGLKARTDFMDLGMLTSVEQIGGEDYFYFEKATCRLINGEFEKIEYKGIELPAPPYLVMRSPYTGEYYFLGKDYLAKGPEFDYPQEIVDQGISKSDYFLENFYGLFFSGGNVFYYLNSQLHKLAPYLDFPLVMDMENLLNIFYINEATVDREGLLWIVTSRGLANVNSLIFQNYGREETTLLGEEITAIADIDDGELLFGFNNGIQKFSRPELETLYRDEYLIGVPTGRIVNFSNDSLTNTTWFSANWDGVGRYEHQTEEISVFPSPKEINISYVDVVGDSLILTGPNDLFMAHKDARGEELYQHNLRSEIATLAVDPYFFLRKASKLKDGRIMVMRAGRLENQNPILENDRFVVAEGYDFYEKNPNKIYLGTESGFKVFEDGEVTMVEVGGQIIDNPVYCILEDSTGKLWLGTDDGVFVIDGDQLIHYNERNGLIGNEINRGALIESSSGRIMIGTVRGFSVYFPREAFYAQASPKLYLNSLTLGGNEVIGTDPVRAPYSENSLEVDYSAVGFNESTSLWVHYRLLGLGSEEWEILVDPKSTRLFFSNLPAGEYQLEIKASYEGTHFSETIISQPFTISKPFYLQTWFIILAILLLVGLGILINMLYRQLRKVGVLKNAFDTKEKEKKITELQFKNVWDSSKDGLLLTLDGKEIIAANPAFAKMSGLSTSELKGKKLLDLLQDDQITENHVDFFRKRVYLNPKKGFTFEGTFSWVTGSLEMEVFSIIIQTEQDDSSLILSVFRDISAKKFTEQNLRDAKEKAEQANRFKSSLLSNISHEIRTPLNGILGGTEHIMMTREEDQVLISQLEIILQSGERLLHTINSILDMAKIEANKMEVAYMDAEINEFVASVVAPLKNLANRKNLKLKEHYLCSPFFGKIDKRFIEMIINNLVSNAIKYTDSGSINLSIDRLDHLLLIEIEDTGVGMSETFLKKVFQPFEQESTGNNRLYDGTGLGLSITKNLIDLLNGKIKIESLKNSGTLVTLEIPLPD